MKFGTKFIAIAFIAVLPLVAVAIQYYATITENEKTVRDIERNAIAEMVFLSNAFNRISSNHAKIFDLLSDANAIEDDEAIYEQSRPLIQEVYAVLDDLTAHYEAAKALEAEPSDGSAVRYRIKDNAALGALIGEIRKYLPEIVNAVEMVTVDLSLSDRYVIRANAIIRRVHADFLSMINETQTGVRRTLVDWNERNNIQRRNFQIIIAAAALIAVAMIFLTAKISGGLSRDLNKIVSVMSRVARGDTDVTVPFLKSRDEIGEIADATKVFVRNLVDLRDAHADLSREAEALRTSEQRFRDLASVASDWFWETDVDFRFTYCSPRFFEILGMPPNDDGETAPGKKMPQTWPNLKAALRLQHAFKNIEIEATAANGNVVKALISGRPNFDADGKFTGHRGTGTDITARVREQKRIRDSEERLHAMFENVTEGIVTTDQNGIVESVNPVLKALLDYTADELIGAPIGILFHAGPLPDSTAILNDATSFQPATFATGQILEFIALSRDGRRIPVDVSFGDFMLGDQRRFIGTMRDLTKRKAVEAEKENLERELEQAAKLEAIGQLAGGIAHEINTPIQYIGDNLRFLRDANHDLMGLIQRVSAVLSDTGEDGPRRDEVAKLMAEAERIELPVLSEEISMATDQSLDGVAQVTRIVGAMKEFSHPGTKEKSHIDINSALESTATVCANEWKGVADLQLDLDPKLPLVSGFPGELNQVFLNLIVNATHAIRDGGGMGKISVSTRKDGNWVNIRIADTGCGIPEGDLDKIFNPFFTTKDVGKGTGQGLSIVQNIVVKKHDGTISVDSKVGAGTTFDIRLPIESARVVDAVQIV